MFVFVVEQTIAHAYVDPAIGRGSEIVFLYAGVGGTKRQTVGKSSLESHFPLVCAGEKVCEEERQIISLVGR